MRFGRVERSLTDQRIWCILIQDENFKRLVDELGHAINDSLSDSDRISHVMDEIRASGYDLFLVLEVTIGFNKRDEDRSTGETEAESSLASPGNGKAASAGANDFHLTNQDAQFLRALRITVDEERR
jgi:hypothetical protein